MTTLAEHLTPIAEHLAGGGTYTTERGGYIYRVEHVRDSIYLIEGKTESGETGSTQAAPGLEQLLERMSMYAAPENWTAESGG